MCGEGRVGVSCGGEASLRPEGASARPVGGLGDVSGLGMGPAGMNPHALPVTESGAQPLPAVLDLFSHPRH